MRLKTTQFNLSTTARLYMGDTVGLEAQLRREGECLEKANPRMPETARCELKRTRKLVPISQSPHKLEVGNKADFLFSRSGHP